MPQAGSQMVKSGAARGSGCTQRTIDWISTRGVKYCPAPFLPSLAAFSSSPSKAAALMSTSSAVHSVSSIRSISRLRFAGLLKRDMAPAKMSPSRPGCLPERAQHVGVVVGQLGARLASSAGQEQSTASSPSCGSRSG